MRCVLLPQESETQVTLPKARQLANEIWLKFKSRQSDPTMFVSNCDAHVLRKTDRQKIYISFHQSMITGMQVEELSKTLITLTIYLTAAIY